MSPLFGSDHWAIVSCYISLYAPTFLYHSCCLSIFCLPVIGSIWYGSSRTIFIGMSVFSLSSLGFKTCYSSALYVIERAPCNSRASGFHGSPESLLLPTTGIFTAGDISDDPFYSTQSCPKVYSWYSKGYFATNDTTCDKSWNRIEFPIRTGTIRGLFASRWKFYVKRETQARRISIGWRYPDVSLPLDVRAYNVVRPWLEENVGIE